MPPACHARSAAAAYVRRRYGAARGGNVRCRLLRLLAARSTGPGSAAADLPECAWKHSEDARFAAGRIDAAVGVYGGAGINSYLLTRLVESADIAGVDQQLPIDAHAERQGFLCTRASYKLDLRGPSMTIQTAYSTSLVAVEGLPRTAARGMTCSGGGVSVPFPQRAGYLYQEGMILLNGWSLPSIDARARVRAQVLVAASSCSRDSPMRWPIGT